MKLNIKFDNTDAEGFKEIVDDVVDELLQTLKPDEISIIRIKNWFDHKWLNFTGKQILKYDTKTHPGIPFVLEPFWNKEITIPPFSPNRVLSESLYRLKEVQNSRFEEIFHITQVTTDNRNNFVANRTKNGLCIWISSNSVLNRQGSMMVYQVKGSEIVTWYIRIEEKGKWKITKTRGIDNNRIQLMLTEVNEKFKSN